MNSTNKAINIFKNPVHCLALGFGAGLSPVAPGTMGTLVALPLYWLCQGLHWLPYTLLVLAMCLAGIWICGVTAKALEQTDPPSVVWDEIAGYFVTMIAAPVGLIWMLVGFGLFRFFDILKPWPVSYCERRFTGGLGIMLDDIVAGVMATAVLFLIAKISFAFFA